MTDQAAATLKNKALELARDEGFVVGGVAGVAGVVGVSGVERVSGGAGVELPHSDIFRRWLDGGMHADMSYLLDRADLICNPSANFPWSKSVLCLGASYAGVESRSDGSIAQYARGRDYHKVLFKAASRVLDRLKEYNPSLSGRVCVDTAPVAERSLAVAAGLGWIGRSSMLVNAGYGTRLLLAEIFLDQLLPADKPVENGCGNCRACVDACPNAAIVADGVVDARKCNSWATIENRGHLDTGIFDTAGYIFGCDCCTDVCPYNTPAPPATPATPATPAEPPADEAMAELIAESAIAGMSVAEILALSHEQWDIATRGSAIRRCGYEGLLRNAAIVAADKGLCECRADLERLAKSDSPYLSQAAGWALDRLEAISE